ncbi:MAG TPA: hypothetical protein VMV90_00235 [Rectinemataceae bacterium]|nr:hypothetical protein [Rectinemataceae bacterium]
MLPLCGVEQRQVGTDILAKVDRFRTQDLSLGRDLTEVWAFGLGTGGWLSYYVGLDWLDDARTIALRSEPKIMGLDMMRMFMDCLDSPATVSYLGEAYCVKAWEPFILCPRESFDCTPFLVLHFLRLLGELVKRPLMKGYTTRRENLRTKIKGKVVIGEHFRRNVLGMRPDRICCQYQDYTTDCAENRLLHTAYLVSMEALSGWKRSGALRCGNIEEYSDIKPYFRGVGEVESLREVTAAKANPIYRNYGEALGLARAIMKIQGYRDSLHEAVRDSRLAYFPPFVIDMSKLFELYVYSLLHEARGEAILYQSKAAFGYTDFLDLDLKIVIDTKYKPRYTGEGRDNGDDMRQIAGYARDLKVLELLGIAGEDRDQVVPCLIIYPDSEGMGTLGPDYYEHRRQDDTRFYKIDKLGVRLPILSSIDGTVP